MHGSSRWRGALPRRSCRLDVSSVSVCQPWRLRRIACAAFSFGIISSGGATELERSQRRNIVQAHSPSLSSRACSANTLFPRDSRSQIFKMVSQDTSSRTHSGGDGLINEVLSRAPSLDWVPYRPRVSRGDVARTFFRSDVGWETAATPGRPCSKHSLSRFTSR
jgi:hypothetical protein